MQIIKRVLFGLSRTLLALLLLGGVCVAGYFVFLAFLTRKLCGEELIETVASPDGKYVAAILIRNCGATTDYVSHLNLRERDVLSHVHGMGRKQTGLY